MLDIDPRPPLEVADERRVMLDSAHRGVSDLLDDLLKGGVSNAAPRLGVLLRRCQEAMGPSLDDLDPIMLGIVSARLDGQAARAEEALMADQAADVRAAAVQVALFLANFPEWTIYQEAMRLPMATPEVEQEAVKIAAEAHRKIREAVPDLNTEAANAALEVLLAEATSGPMAEAEEGVAPEIARRSYLRANREAFRLYAVDAVARFRKGSLDGVESFVRTGTVIGLSAASGFLIALAAGLPGEFGFLGGVAAWIRSLFA